MTQQPTDLARMRAYLLDRLRIDVQTDGFDRGDLLAVLCPVPPDDAWQDYRSVPDPKDGAWFLWRDPCGIASRVHADQIMVEHGSIAGKFGCGLSFYTECAPLLMPDDVALVMGGASGAREPEAPA